MAVGAPHQHLRENADAQALFYHGQNGKIIAEGVLDVGPQALLLEDAGDLHVPILLNEDKGVLRKTGHRVTLCPCQRMVRREYRQQPVPPERGDVQAVPRWKAQKAAVHQPPPYQLLHFGEFPLADQLEADAGVKGQKLLHDSREPVDGDAGEGAYPQRAAGEAVKCGDLALQGSLGVAQGLNVRQKGLPLGGEDHSVLVPGQQGDVPLPLQVSDRPAHRRLCVPHVLRCPGNAPQFHGL